MVVQGRGSRPPTRKRDRLSNKDVDFGIIRDTVPQLNL